MLLAWATALAGSMAGTSIPSVGGSFMGATEPGAMGVIFNPAATAHGEAPELAADVAAVHTTFSMWLNNWEGPRTDSGVSIQPTVALSVPIAEQFGLGLALHGDYIRGTDYGDFPETRLYSISSTYSLIHTDITGSFKATEWLSVGGGARIGQMSYGNRKGTDLGVTLNASTSIDPPLPVGDPVLQGFQEIPTISAITASFLLGARAEFGDVQLDLSFRPKWPVKMRGTVELQPSQVLDAQIDGTIDVIVNMPAHVLLASRIQASPKWTLVPELEWVGWKSASANTAIVSDLRLTAGDPALDELLEQAGLSQAEFIRSQEGPTDVDLGWSDALNVSFQTLYAPREDIQIRAGAGFSPGVIPEPTVTPNNVDFGALWLRLGGAMRVHDAVRVAVSGERYEAFTRRVVDSPHSLDPQPGYPAIPSANGNYAFGIWRAGLTLQFFVPPKPRASS